MPEIPTAKNLREREPLEIKEKSVEKPCLFDNSKDCPARIAHTQSKGNDWVDFGDLAEKVCSICPMRMRLPANAM